MLEQLQRCEVSNPPAYGAKIAHLVMSDNDLRKTWFDDLITMSSRIQMMRRALYNGLLGHGELQSPRAFILIANTGHKRRPWRLEAYHSPVRHVFLSRFVAEHC